MSNRRRVWNFFSGLYLPKIASLVFPGSFGPNTFAWLESCFSELFIGIDGKCQKKYKLNFQKKFTQYKNYSKYFTLVIKKSQWFPSKSFFPACCDYCQ